MVPGELGKRDGARGCSLRVCEPLRFPPPEPRPSISGEDSILSNNYFGITSPASPPSTIHATQRRREAKKTVATILDQFGWETADMGSVQAARAIEPLCILWCVPGMLRNEWTHAFKLLR